MFCGPTRSLPPCHPAASRTRTAGAPGAMAEAIPAGCRFIASVLEQVLARCWQWGGPGPAPRPDAGPQTRVSLPCWPTRAFAGKTVARTVFWRGSPQGLAVQPAGRRSTRPVRPLQHERDHQHPPRRWDRIAAAGPAGAKSLPRRAAKGGDHRHRRAPRRHWCGRGPAPDHRRSRRPDQYLQLCAAECAMEAPTRRLAPASDLCGR